MTLNEWAKYIAQWRRKKGFKTDMDNMPEKLLLVITEIAEATEAIRQVPIDMENFAEEIADAMIRLLDIAGSLNIDIDKAIAAKMKYNESRPHKHGKRF
jgi:NTP pyrophosphatase (non-canonical NTP hydrolase)